MPDARGKGLGRALMTACEGWSRDRSHKLLMVGVLAHNRRAIRSFEGAGFSPYTLLLRRYL
ncbi:MAG: GNAT family N-acetyltransferase [Alphaproteobacteria bacterium]|nr:GNAT family N-acetyltransferase [Alphaproteobacteria bacterium]